MPLRGITNISKEKIMYVIKVKCLFNLVKEYRALQHTDIRKHHPLIVKLQTGNRILKSLYSIETVNN